MADQAEYHASDPEHRARVVAGIRALADLIETDLDLPVPASVSAQYSLAGDLDDGQRQFVREIAAHLGITVDGGPDSYTINNAAYATVQHLVASSGLYEQWFRVAYVVHGSRDDEAGEQA